MLRWSVIFLIVAFVAALLGFGRDRWRSGRNSTDSVLRLSRRVFGQPSF